MTRHRSKACSTSLLLSKSKVRASSTRSYVRAQEIIAFEMACNRIISVDRNLQAREVLGPLGNLQLEPYLVRKLKNTQIFVGHTGTVNSISWSLDGSKVLSAGEDCKMNIWNVQCSGKGQVLHSFDTVSLGILRPLLSAWGRLCAQLKKYQFFCCSHTNLWDVRAVLMPPALYALINGDICRCQ